MHEFPYYDRTNIHVIGFNANFCLDNLSIEMGSTLQRNVLITERMVVCTKIQSKFVEILIQIVNQFKKRKRFLLLSYNLNVGLCKINEISMNDKSKCKQVYVDIPLSLNSVNSIKYTTKNII